MKNIAPLLEGLSQTPRLLKELILEFPEEKRIEQVMPGKWSLHEHAVHMAISDVYGFQKRLRQFLEEDVPVIEPLSGDTFDKDFFIKKDLMNALDDFFPMRQETIELAQQFPNGLLDKRANHPEYEVYTPYIMLRHLLMHDMYHMYKIEDLGFGITF